MEEGLGQLAVSIVGDVQKLIGALEEGKKKVQEFASQVNKDLSGVEARLKGIGASSIGKGGSGGGKRGGKSPEALAADEVRKQLELQARLLKLESERLKVQGMLVQAANKTKEAQVKLAEAAEKTTEEINKIKQVGEAKINQAMDWATGRTPKSPAQILRQQQQNELQKISNQAKDFRQRGMEVEARQIEKERALLSAKYRQSTESQLQVLQKFHDERIRLAQEGKTKASGLEAQTASERTLSNQAKAAKSLGDELRKISLLEKRDIEIEARKGAKPDSDVITSIKERARAEREAARGAAFERVRRREEQEEKQYQKRRQDSIRTDLSNFSREAQAIGDKKLAIQARAQRDIRSAEFKGLDQETIAGIKTRETAELAAEDKRLGEVQAKLAEKRLGYEVKLANAQQNRIDALHLEEAAAVSKAQREGASTRDIQTIRETFDKRREQEDLAFQNRRMKREEEITRVQADGYKAAGEFRKELDLREQIALSKAQRRSKDQTEYLREEQAIREQFAAKHKKLDEDLAQPPKKTRADLAAGREDKRLFDNRIKALQEQATMLRDQKKLTEAAQVEGRVRVLQGEKRGFTPDQMASIHNRNAEAVKRARTEQDKLTNSTEETGQAISRLTGMIQRMIGAFVIYKLVDGFRMIIRAGLEFNAIMEGTQAGIAGLLISVKNYVDITTGKAVNTTRAYGAAMVEAAQNMKLLQQINLETAATLPEILTQYQQLIATMGGLKDATPENLTALTKRFSILGQMFMIPQQQMMEEIRSATTGAMKPGLTRILPFFVGQFQKMGLSGTPNEIIRGWRAAGVEVEKMLELLAPMEDIAKQLQGTWAVAMSNLKDLAEMLLGEGFKPLFEYIRDNVNTITEALKDPQERQKLLAGLRGINTALVDMANNAKLIGSVLFGGLTALGEWPMRVAGMAVQVAILGVVIKGLILLFTLLKNAFRLTAAEGAGFFAKFGGLWIALAVTGLLEIIQHWDWLSKTIQNAGNALSDFLLLNRLPIPDWLKNLISPPIQSGSVGRTFPSTAEEYKRKRAAAGMPILEDDPDTKRLKEEVARSLKGQVVGIQIPTHEDLEREKEIHEWRVKRLRLHKMELQALEQERDASLKLITDEKVRAEAAKYYDDLILQTRIRNEQELRDTKLETARLFRKAAKPEEEMEEWERLRVIIQEIRDKLEADLKNERFHRNDPQVINSMREKAQAQIEFETQESRRRMVKLALDAAHDEMEIDRKKTETRIALGEIASTARVNQIQQEITQTQALLDRQDLQPSQRKTEQKHLADLKLDLPKARMEVRQEAFDRLQTIFDTQESRLEEQIALGERHKKEMVSFLENEIFKWKELRDEITLTNKEQEDYDKKIAGLEEKKAKVIKSNRREDIDLEKQRSQLMLERSRFELNQGQITRPTFLKRIKDQIASLEFEKAKVEGKDPQQVLQIEREILALQQEYAGLTVNVWAEAQNAIVDGFMNILDGTQSFGEGFLSFFKSLTRKILQIMVEDLAQQIVKIMKQTVEQAQTRTEDSKTSSGEGTKGIFSSFKSLLGIFGGKSSLQSPDGGKGGIPRPDQPQDQMGQMGQASGGIGKYLGYIGAATNVISSAASGGTGRTIGSAVGAITGSYFGSVGSMVGSQIGGMLGGLFDKKKKKDPIRAAIKEWVTNEWRPAWTELERMGFGRGPFEGINSSTMIKAMGWGKKIPQQLLESMKSAAEALKDALSEALDKAFKNVTVQGGFRSFLRNLRRSISDFVIEGMIEAMLKSNAMIKLLAPLSDLVTEATETVLKGKPLDVEAYHNRGREILGTLNTSLITLEPLFGELFGAAKEFQQFSRPSGSLWEGLPPNILAEITQANTAHTGGIITRGGLANVAAGEEIRNPNQPQFRNQESKEYNTNNFYFPTPVTNPAMIATQINWRLDRRTRRVRW